MNCLEVREREQSAQVGLDVLLVFRDRRQTERYPGRVNEHSLCAQVQSLSIQANPTVHSPGATLKVDQCLLIQAHLEKRTPILY